QWPTNKRFCRHWCPDPEIISTLKPSNRVTLSTCREPSGGARRAGGSLHNIVKMTVYILDYKNSPIINKVLAKHLRVAAFPRGAEIEIESIAVLPKQLVPSIISSPF
ncbi:unnamed protein product, partial [Medioppia subpectinata]